MMIRNGKRFFQTSFIIINWKKRKNTSFSTTSIVTSKKNGDGGGRRWDDLDSTSICNITLNNMIASCTNSENSENSQIISLLRLLKKQNNSSTSSSSSPATREDSVLNDAIKIELHGSKGIYADEINAEYLHDPAPSIKYQPVLFSTSASTSASTGRSGNQSKMNNASSSSSSVNKNEEGDDEYVVSSEFEHMLNRVIVSLNLSAQRNKRHLIEDILMESLMGLPRRQKKNAPPAINPANDFIHDILKSSLVGIHSDFTHRYPLDDTSTSTSNITTTHGNSSDGDGSGGGNVVKTFYRFPYAVVPLYNVDNTAYIDAKKSRRVMALVFTCEGNSGELSDTSSALKALERRRFAIKQVLDSCTFERNVTSPSSPQISAGGIEEGADGIISNEEVDALPWRPLNVILTDGIRWHFSRYERDLPGIDARSHISGMSEVDLYTLQQFYNIKLNASLQQQQQQQQQPMQHPLLKLATSTLARSRNNIKTKGLEVEGCKGENIICKYHSSVLSLGASHVVPILKILRWSIRGLSGPSPQSPNLPKAKRSQ